MAYKILKGNELEEGYFDHDVDMIFARGVSDSSPNVVRFSIVTIIRYSRKIFGIKDWMVLLTR